MRDLHLDRGYDLVVTPHIARSVLWETSGHLAKYADNMYPPMQTDTGDYYVKPMNCPFHVLVYKSQVRSYRDLPMRLSELGTIYRHERLGALHGLLRIRGGTQDDSHIICTPDQLIDEILKVFELTFEIHATFGFGDPIINLSTLPGQTILDDAMAARATEALVMALERSGLPYTEAAGEGTFYGPKVDFHFKDAIGRLWQLTTVQCDFALPERFDMEYTGDDNDRHRPVMIHRAILGTLERFSARADRALRRRVPALAVAGAHPVRPGRGPPRRVLRGPGGARGGGRAAAVRRRLEGDRRQEDPRVAADEGAVHPGGGGPRHRGRTRSRSATATATRRPAWRSTTS